MTRQARIGVVVPFDAALDREYWDLVPADVSVHITRTPFHHGSVGIPLARAVAEPDEAADAVGSLVAIEPDAIAYACTSGSFVNGVAGEEALRDAMLAAGARAAVTTSGALVEALRQLGVRRVALGTPYVAELGQLLRAFLVEAGFEPASLVNLELEERIADVGSAEVERLANAAMAAATGAEALFLACTNLRTVDMLRPLAVRHGVPVLSANQVTMWAALRAAGIDATQAGFGAPPSSNSPTSASQLSN